MRTVLSSPNYLKPYLRTDLCPGQPAIRGLVEQRLHLAIEQGLAWWNRFTGFWFITLAFPCLDLDPTRGGLGEIHIQDISRQAGSAHRESLCCTWSEGEELGRPWR